MAETVLKLSTIKFDRPTIDIEVDDRGFIAYQMRSRQELSVKTAKRMGEIADELEADEEMDMDSVAASLAEQVDLVMVDLPADVKEQLPLGMLAEILKAFTRLAGGESESLASDETS